jgi:hypothetical protein
MPGGTSAITDGTTFISPFGLGFGLCMCLLLVVLPRRFVAFPIVALVCFMTMGERVIVAGLNFTLLRILLLFGWGRLVLRGELRSIRLNRIDRAILWWTLSSIVIYVLLWQSFDAFQNKLGLAYNAVGFYFLFRFLVRDFDDAMRMVKTTALLIMPLAGIMVVEKLTGKNSFAIFGGVSPVTALRDGVLRCQGPFAHPILAGTFGATLFPLFVALWVSCRRIRSVALLGMLSAIVITVTSGSSGPIMALLAGVIGLSVWRLQPHMRKVRWSMIFCLIGLQLAMKAPVWFLMARVDIFSGSTGYHRAYLIDSAVRHVDGWWLVGTKSTLSWADEDQGLFDVTNQYLIEGADGGLLTLILFITIIVRAFQGVGRSVRATKGGDDQRLPLALWAMGAALLSHTVSYMSVSYFDQNIVGWYLLLAVIATATDQFSAERAGQGAADRAAHAESVLGAGSSEERVPGVAPAWRLSPTGWIGAV